MRYWIKDEDNTPQRFPLKALILLIIEQLGSTIYNFWILRARGYGTSICEWNNLSDENDRIRVDIELLLNASTGIEQWFYDLEVEVVTEPDSRIKFGLHDSTALYIDAPKEFAESIVKSFKNVVKG
ncbi:MAG: hypothetical protein HN356_10250 [Calditrichaeota bacterium]|nr:hypothetical protein [Calditrichota bacterium]MBT7617536.1 hypothetical protein [Calditrichota bacterium]MBT7787804.1 hypothetical protein [Calditrichota bacterium]